VAALSAGSRRLRLSTRTLEWASVHECPLTEALAGRTDTMLQLAVVLSLI